MWIPSSVKWKNERPPKHLPYNPTLVEHVANTVTHGVSFIYYFMLPFDYAIFDVIDFYAFKKSIFYYSDLFYR